MVKYYWKVTDVMKCCKKDEHHVLFTHFCKISKKFLGPLVGQKLHTYQQKEKKISSRVFYCF